MTVRRLARTVAGAAAVLGIVAGCGADPDEPDEPREPVDPSSPSADSAPGGGDDVPFRADLLTVSPDGSTVLASCTGGLCRWDATGRPQPGVADTALAVSPDWSAAVRIDDGALVLTDLDGTQTTELIQLDDGVGVEDVVFSPDGSLVAAATSEGSVTAWSTGSASPPTVLDAGGPGTELAFSPDAARLAVSGDDGTAVYDLGTGEVAGDLTGSTSGPVAWTPDGRWLVGSGPGDDPTIWDASTYEQGSTLPGYELAALAVAPDSGAVALLSDGFTGVTQWRPTELGGRPPLRRELRGHLVAPESLAYSPDGVRLYSVGPDETVIAWNAATAEQVGQLDPSD